MTSLFLPPAGSADERTQFAALQARLREHFVRFAADPTRPYTAVVIPSQSFDPAELAKISGVAHYEERSLFNLMLLRHPRLRLIYVTSKRLNPLIIDYYLHQMRGVPPAHARMRLTLFDCDDAAPIALTSKILARPRLVQRIRDAIRDPENAHMVCFNSTPLERTLAVQLGIPLNSCDPELTHLGSKTGSRNVFRAAGVEMAPGREGLSDEHELVSAVAETWHESPDTSRIVVKLDESFSGEGNAILDLRELESGHPRDSSVADTEKAVAAAMPNLRFEAPGLTWGAYREQFNRMGGICEVWVEGEGKTSPSVQLRINPVREVQVISTHDQLLGGPGGQVFLGATFPANGRYRLAMQDLSMRVGQVLADKGVIGRFGVDFLAIPQADGPDRLVAVEINLRAGGTTHPFNTLKFITGGQYDAKTGTYSTGGGRERCYFTTDTLQSDDYKGTLPFDLMDLLVVHGVHFRYDDTGVVFHLLGCLSQFGKIGCLAIAPTVDESLAIYDRTVALMNEHLVNG